MSKIPVALQLYSIRDACAKDFPGTLREVARMGYQGVEFAGFHNFSAADVLKMMTETGLKPAGAHVGIQSLLGDEFEKTVAYHKTIGNTYLIVPGLPPEYRGFYADHPRLKEILAEQGGDIENSQPSGPQDYRSPR